MRPVNWAFYEVVSRTGSRCFLAAVPFPLKLPPPMLMNDFASACSFTRAAASNNLASERLDASAGLLNYRQITKLPLQTVSELNIGTVPM